MLVMNQNYPRTITIPYGCICWLAMSKAKHGGTDAMVRLAMTLTEENGVSVREEQRIPDLRRVTGQWSK